MVLDIRQLAITFF